MTKSFGYTDSVTNTKSISIPTISYTSDFSRDTRVSKKGEQIINNRTSPLDQPETVRFAIDNISNIYKDTSIDPSAMSVSTKGLSLLVQLNDILRVTPDEGSGVYPIMPVDLPIGAHLVLKVPSSQYVTATEAMNVVHRLVAFLYETDGTGLTRLEGLLRGALLPTGM